MDHLVRDVRGAVQVGLHYAALTLALTLPDAAAKAVDPDKKVGDRYEAWVTRWVLPRLQSSMTATDLYKLRCAVLHEAKDHDLIESILRTWTIRARGPRGGQVHGNTSRSKGAVTKDLQLELLTEAICVGVQKWWEQADDTVKERAASTIRIAVL